MIYLKKAIDLFAIALMIGGIILLLNAGGNLELHNDFPLAEGVKRALIAWFMIGSSAYIKRR